MKEITRITISIPEERHGHLRKGSMAKKVVPHSNLYSNVIAFGNFVDCPVDNAERLTEYRNEILSLNPMFRPHFGIMVTPRTTPEVVEEAFENGAEFTKTMFVGSTTGSSTGIAIDHVEEKFPSYEKAGELGMPNLFHFERVETKDGKPIPFLYREEEAVPDAQKVINALPNAKIGIEHVSTAAMVGVVEASGPSVIATITAHHPTGLYEDVCDKNGKIINPHNLCMPILKLINDRTAVRIAMIYRDYKKFRSGTDNAPHPIEAKLSGMPGVFVPDELALALYCQRFDEERNLNRLGGFLSCNQTDTEFYGFSPSEKTITLVKEEWTVPMKISGLVPYMAGKKMQWKVKR